MSRILQHLLQGLDFDEREEVERRYQLMVSEMSYLLETKPELLRAVAKLGWSTSKLEAVFCLNSFYQRILAPLVASGIDPHVVGSKIPIRFGQSLVFDSARVNRMLELDHSFQELCIGSDILPFMLEAQRTSDLIWLLARSDSPTNNENGGE